MRTYGGSRRAKSDEGEALVSGRLLADITAALPKSEPVGLVLDGTRLIVTAGSARFTLHALPLEDYPALPAVPAEIGTVSGAALAAPVSKVSPAAGRDDTITELTGIQIAADEDQALLLTATDRHRFPVVRLPWQPTLDEDVTVPTMLPPTKILADAAKHRTTPALAGTTYLVDKANV
ncbi:hypothetical protein GCM10009801_27370 [Streptomyces albiaxialis]|uniref:DNA polymerase III beta sliding clamp central domain-containing protein n=1 Tax=Streptomyces albiaxialis TaxID=329523 RepID=A0ABP5HEB2_9ACTN